METDTAVADDVPKPTELLVGGTRFSAGSHGLATAVAQAYATSSRPRCLCVPGGVEMYVARYRDGYAVKRMPGTGSRHMPDCQSYEPPEDATGISRLMGSAISEDVDTGRTTLRLAFPLSKRPGQWVRQVSSAAPGCASGSAPGLSLRSLLDYLWDQGELTRWHPSFHGKRNWPTVRRRLLAAAEDKIVCGASLGSKLYVPEPFSVEERAAADARRELFWFQAIARTGGHQPLLLLVAEVKRIEPARFGHRLLIKQLPDTAFSIDAPLYAAMTRRFTGELSLWSASDAVRMITAATFSVNAAGVPKVAELCLMPVTREWLPAETLQELHLVARLVAERRAFIKLMRYGLPLDTRMASVSLTDCGRSSSPVFLDADSASATA